MENFTNKFNHSFRLIRRKSINSIIGTTTLDVDNYTIHKVSTMEEIHGIVEIQRKAWEMPDLEVVPTFEMKAVTSFGIVLVAKDDKGKPIGFIYALPQFPNRHYSHMMAVLPQWQGKNVGYNLKLYHRNLALKSGHNINTINWTVDPLLPNNAYLNFVKLGGVCSIYYPNYYGDPEEVGIYKGVPTDRFLLEWHINSERVINRIDKSVTSKLSKSELMKKRKVINTIENQYWVDTVKYNDLGGFLVQIPTDFQELKSDAIEIAIDWRLKFRELCLDAYNNGYLTSDFHTYIHDEKRENYYEFENRENINV